MTDRQAAILRFIAEFWETHGFGPVLAEIGVGVGLKTRSSVDYQIRQLVALGLVRRNPLLARTIRLVRHDESAPNTCTETGKIEGADRERANAQTGRLDPADEERDPHGL